MSIAPVAAPAALGAAVDRLDARSARPTVAVVGGGASAVALALALAGRDVQLVVVDPQDRPGRGAGYDSARPCRLDFVRGHLAEVAPAGDGVRVRLRARGPSRALTTFQARWFVLATGPGPHGAAHDPLLGELVVTGLATTDASGLGVHSDARGGVLDPRGRVQAGLHALGPVRRGEGPETTALREIRAQAAALAERVGAEARATAVTGVAPAAGGPGAAR